MRLIDADNINFHCNYDGDCPGDIDDCKKCGNYICDFRDIQEQPIAYDIGKVVNELEKATQYIKIDGKPTSVKAIHPVQAIEIVKHGGVVEEVNK